MPGIPSSGSPVAKPLKPTFPRHVLNRDKTARLTAHLDREDTMNGRRRDSLDVGRQKMQQEQAHSRRFPPTERDHFRRETTATAGLTTGD